MNRRDFFKALGLGVAVAALPTPAPMPTVASPMVELPPVDYPWGRWYVQEIDAFGKGGPWRPVPVLFQDSKPLVPWRAPATT